MTPTEAHGNLAGSVNGAALFALADAAFEVACNSYGRVCLALETSCHYRKPAAIGDALTAAASEVARGTKTGSYRIDLRSSDGDLVAWYMALAYRTDRWHLGEDRWPEAWRSSH